MANFLIPAAAASIGGLLGGLGGKGKFKKASRFNEGQQQFFDMLAQALGGGGGVFGDLVAPFDEEAASQRFDLGIAQPALEQFAEQIVPTITGQFRGQNLGQSSYLGQGLAREGSRLERDLAATKANELFQGREAGINRRLNALQNYLGTQTFDYSPQQNLFDKILGGAGVGLKAVSPYGDLFKGK